MVTQLRATVNFIGMRGCASDIVRGFEVVLFLQSYWLQLGGTVVFYGALVLVLGSYFLSRYQAVLLPKKHGIASYAHREAEPTTKAVSAPVSALEAHKG